MIDILYPWLNGACWFVAGASTMLAALTWPRKGEENER